MRRTILAEQKPETAHFIADGGKGTMTRKSPNAANRGFRRPSEWPDASRIITRPTLTGRSSEQPSETDSHVSPSEVQSEVLISCRRILTMRHKGLWFSAGISAAVASAGLAVLVALPAVSQDNSSKKRETVAKPLTDKEKKKKEAALKKELETPWRSG